LAITPTRLMTFAEFEKLPDDAQGYRYELHHGELVKVAPPENRHFLIQQMLRDLLDQAAAGAGRAYTEVGFRPLPEHEYLIADVAYLSYELLAKYGDQEYFQGVPELVIEVLSPSNTPKQIADKRTLCLSNGGLEFWVVDGDQHQVEVSTPDGRIVTYKSGQEIPLRFGGRLAVAAIFGKRRF
jgi:Uma2 family endonuclease